MKLPCMPQGPGPACCWTQPAGGGGEGRDGSQGLKGGDYLGWGNSGPL